MIYFHNDYAEGCHESILKRLAQTNLEQSPGYGTDQFCANAANRIRELCGDPSLSVHFLVGGTQANATVIDAALKPYQGVVCADTGHINVHETGAIEHSGHKVLALPAEKGLLKAAQIRQAMEEHLAEDGPEEDAMLSEAIRVVVENGMASTSLLQRKLKLGYARAARIVDEMEQRGVVGPYKGAKPRDVLITMDQLMEMEAAGEE